MDNMIAIIIQYPGKSDVCGRMNQNIVSLGTEYVKGTCYTSENSVFITNLFFCKIRNSFTVSVPLNDTVVVFIFYIEISVSRMLCSFNECFCYSWNSCKIHICNPHWNAIETITDMYLIDDTKSVRQIVYCKGIFAFAVNDTCKIVFHYLNSFI